MNLIMPYLKEDNSCNLPYMIKKDKNNCDVLVMEEKQIPLNITNTTLNYQLSIYNNCLDEYQHKAYQVMNNIYILLRYKKNKYVVSGQIDIIDHGNVYNLCDFENNDMDMYNISYNDKYIVAFKTDPEGYTKEVVEAYDIRNKKMIDCNDYNSVNGLLNNVVNKRHCKFDVIISILTGKITNENRERVLNFLSYITKENIDETNYYDVLSKTRKYILSCYPELNDINLNISGDQIKLQSHKYSLDYFSFNPIDSTVPNIKYKKQHVKVKTRF